MDWVGGSSAGRWVCLGGKEFVGMERVLCGFDSEDLSKGAEMECIILPELRLCENLGFR